MWGHLGRRYSPLRALLGPRPAKARLGRRDNSSRGFSGEKSDRRHEDPACYTPDFVEFSDVTETSRSPDARENCRFRVTSDLAKSFATTEVHAPWEAVLLQPLVIINDVVILFSDLRTGTTPSYL